MSEISLDDRERVHVDRIVFALGCGRNVNADLIRAQVEGGPLWDFSNKPFCDGTHATIDFDGTLAN